jgi:hypothetical protein
MSVRWNHHYWAMCYATELARDTGIRHRVYRSAGYWLVKRVEGTWVA